MSAPRPSRIEIDGIGVSFLFRPGGAAREAVVFIHGLGASGDCFAGAFEREAFLPLTLLAADLVGFGGSDKPERFSYTMDAQARVLLRLMDELGIGPFHLVAHSMGGIVGLHLSRGDGGRLSSFLSAEGNLTPEDCTMSRGVIRGTEEDFAAGGFDAFRAALEKSVEGAPGDFSGERYLAMLRRTTARAFYRSALSTVRESDKGELLPAFLDLSCRTCYLCGERNRGLFPAERILVEKGVPVRYVPLSGHAMMDDNPDGFYEAVLQAVGVRS
jgi:pimeloyl-ACP methyl ester carboxylesterase